MKYEVKIFLKAGETITFSAKNVTLTLEDDDPQRIKEFTWERAVPALLFLHLDNVAAVQTRRLPEMDVLPGK